MPHCASRDDWYEGMFIPKGSMVLLPAYAANRLESNGYKDPTAYNPDRYIGETRLAAELAAVADYESRDKYKPSLRKKAKTDRKIHIITATGPEGASARACTWPIGPCGE